MLYIIGVAHRAQSRRPDVELTPEQNQFSLCIRQIIQAARPRFVAEEDSEEALAERNQLSIAEEICDAAGVEHRLCDPTQAQRQTLNYRNGQELDIFKHDDNNLSNSEIHLKARAIELGRYFLIRERFWLERLEGCRQHDAVFVCGDAHIVSFTSLLNEQGVRYEIVERGIGVTPQEIEDFRQIREYLEAHPHLATG